MPAILGRLDGNLFDFRLPIRALGEGNLQHPVLELRRGLVGLHCHRQGDGALKCPIAEFLSMEVFVQASDTILSF